MMDDTDAILRCERNWRYQQGYQDGYRDGKTDAQKLGQWIICGDGYYPYCSICKNEPKSRIMTDYCPNCGAKMDGRG